MNATIEVQKELPALEQGWNPKRYWLVSGASIVGFFVASLAAGISVNVSFGMFTIATVVVMAAFTRSKNRLEFLRMQKIGLEQFKATAESNPGAPASVLVAMMEW